MQYVYLLIAIVSEVCATLSLRQAALGRTRFYIVVAIGYTLGFVGLLGALRAGMPLGIAYGIWAALGVALTAIASRLLFRDPLTRTMAGGIVLIVIGVLLIELGAAR